MLAIPVFLTFILVIVLMAMMLIQQGFWGIVGLVIALLPAACILVCIVIFILRETECLEKRRKRQADDKRQRFNACVNNPLLDDE